MATPSKSKKSTKKQEPPERRNCGTGVVHERLLRTAPGYLDARNAIENHAWRSARTGAAGRSGCTKIPVVVHVVYKTAAENVSQAQIDSQIDVLNEDFRKANPDVSTVPAAFQPLVADARVEFELASVDPDGNPTDGIVRVQTTSNSFTDDDLVKFAASGGSDAWPRDQYLNIWVCNLVPWLGYAQFPGGPANTDGVVITHTGFGTTGTAAAPFDKGRTATHEIGHWLNLRHIWGDDGGGCGGSDLVADTPNQGGANYGTPTFPNVSCANAPNGDMFMNYMDYVDDAAMVMFTTGQVARMQATLDGSRSSIGAPTPCGSTPIKKLEPDQIKKFEPDIKKREPDQIKKFEPDIKKREPDQIKKFEPDVKKHEPDIKKREPDQIKKFEPDVKKHEPDIKKREPDSIKKNEPDVKKHEPDIKKREPDSIKKNEPDIKKREPDSIKKNEPDVKKHEPDIKKREPDSIKKNEPDVKKREPDGIKKNEPDGPKWGYEIPTPWETQPTGGQPMGGQPMSGQPTGDQPPQMPGGDPNAMWALDERLRRIEEALAQFQHFIPEGMRPEVEKAPLQYEDDFEGG